MKAQTKKYVLAILLAVGLAFGFAGAGQVASAAPAPSETVAVETEAAEAPAVETLETEQIGTYSYINRQCRYVGYSNGFEYWQLYLWWQPSGWEFLMGQRAHFRPYGAVTKKVYYWRNNDANGVACW